MIPMLDGIQLQTRVWLPTGQGPFPVVSTRGYSAGWHCTNNDMTTAFRKQIFIHIIGLLGMGGRTN
jgi:predicted acyl esterase